MWNAFSEAFCDLPSGPERRRWLLAVLEQLAKRGDIQLPVRHGKLWDRSNAIVLPTIIKLVVDNDEHDAKIPWRNFPWHPDLQWVLQCQASPDQVAFLKRVNEGVVEGWFVQQECFKYRSLQLTGDEKRLERFLKGILFGPDCLTLEMLGCGRDALPLATEHISSEATMIIFENAAPFMLARSIAATTNSSRFGRLAYGAGTQVLKAAAYFAMIDPPLKEILYVGDLDAEGLRIARPDLQRLSKSVSVRHAHEFYRAMVKSAIDLGFPEGWPVKYDRIPDMSELILSVLPSDLRQNVQALVASGRRIPEEVLSRATMSRLL